MTPLELTTCTHARARARTHTHTRSLARSLTHSLTHSLTQNDGLLIELLKLTTVILKHTPELFGAYHKELIGRIWRPLKRDNYLVVSYAYQTVAQYLRSNVAPDNIVLQVRVCVCACVCVCVCVCARARARANARACVLRV